MQDLFLKGFLALQKHVDGIASIIQVKYLTHFSRLSSPSFPLLCIVHLRQLCFDNSCSMAINAKQQLTVCAPGEHLYIYFCFPFFRCCQRQCFSVTSVIPAPSFYTLSSLLSQITVPTVPVGYFVAHRGQFGQLAHQTVRLVPRAHKQHSTIILAVIFLL